MDVQRWITKAALEIGSRLEERGGRIARWAWARRGARSSSAGIGRPTELPTWAAGNGKVDGPR